MSFQNIPGPLRIHRATGHLGVTVLSVKLQDLGHSLVGLKIRLQIRSVKMIMCLPFGVRRHDAALQMRSYCCRHPRNLRLNAFLFLFALRPLSALREAPLLDAPPRQTYTRAREIGGMAEWSKATVLKTVRGEQPLVGSNPAPSAKSLIAPVCGLVRPVRTRPQGRIQGVRLATPPLIRRRPPPVFVGLRVQRAAGVAAQKARRRE